MSNFDELQISVKDKMKAIKDVINNEVANVHNVVWISDRDDNNNNNILLFTMTLVTH